MFVLVLWRAISIEICINHKVEDVPSPKVHQHRIPFSQAHLNLLSVIRSSLLILEGQRIASSNPMLSTQQKRLTSPVNTNMDTRKVGQLVAETPGKPFALEISSMR